MRILADHVRTSVMLIGDEARLLPSNTGAGYVLRRLVRRAVRHGRTLGLKKEDFIKIASIYIDDVYAASYPLLVKNREFVLKEFDKEIVRFESTLENGMKEFKKILDATTKSGAKEISGKDAFYLYDTFGFPSELTVEMAAEEGLTVDEKGFVAAMEEQKKTARANAAFSQKSADASVFDELGLEKSSTFTGYDRLLDNSTVIGVANEESLADSISEGESGTVVTEVTPFYATMGGQKGDKGIIKTASGEFKVVEAVKLPGGLIGHLGTVIKGEIKNGEAAELSVCDKCRAATCKNHSATHILQSALQEVLGDGVHQQGSYQDTERTRFDFSYSQAMTADEIKKVEAIVNAKIAEDAAVVTNVMTIDEAKQTGAMALFGEKYGETVRVVSMGDFSKELCGGTHVSHTGEIQAFKILSEASVSSGVRRIEAITGTNVAAYYAELEEKLAAAAAAAKTTPAELVNRINAMQAQIKELNSEIESLKSKAAKEALGDVMDQVKEVKGVKLLATAVAGVDMNGLRDLGDQLKEKLGEGVVVLISDCDGKVNLVVMATDAAQKSGAHAGNLVKAVAALVGGGGGGRPNMAQAGGKNPAGIPDAIAKAEEILADQIK